MAYFEVIPIGEVINGVLIIRKEPDKTLHRMKNYQDKGSVFECTCTLCGNKVYRTANVIITGAVQPCFACRKKYKLVEVSPKIEQYYEQDEI